jgi:bifunctional non-homologous end joining protein LigD
VRIRSRRGTDMAPCFPELAGLADAVGAQRALVDGELIALDPTGPPTSPRSNSGCSAADAQPVPAR